MNLAAQVHEYFEPAVYNSTRATPGARLRWHPQLEEMFQGTRWHRAGLLTTSEQRHAVREAEAAIFSGGLEMTGLRVWQTLDPNTVLMEWRCAGTSWNGHGVANGGLSVFEFEEGAVRRARHFTNTAYMEAVEESWTELLPIDTLLRIPAYHTLRLHPEDWKPLSPSPTAKLHTSPSRVFPESLTNEQRVARRHEPAVPIAEKDKGERYAFAPDFYYEYQGTRWPLSGRNRLAALGEIWEPINRILGQSLEFTHLKTWGSADDRWVFMEWVSRARTWREMPFANHGLAALHFNERDECDAYHDYCNVAYVEAILDGWRELMRDEQFAQLDCARTLDLPSESWKPLPIGEATGSG